MKLQTLYKTSKTGATQVFNIEALGDSYTVMWGQVNGKQQTKTTKCTSKNEGKANETTPEEQAILEATAVWTKKQKANYSTSEEAPVTVNLPMKVKALQDQLKNVVYPCVSTPKLNGINGTYRLIDEELVLTSRGGEVYPPIPHLEEELLEIMTMLNSRELNGELYIHGEHLQDISSSVKKPKELSKRLTFNIFDIADSTADYDTRRDIMSFTECATTENMYVLFLTGTECDTMNEIEIHYNQCMDAGLEGTVIKNLSGLYTYNTRSCDQFKYKKTQDGEFETVSYTLDKNGHVVFTCVNTAVLVPIPGKVISNGINTMHPKFKVKLKGTNEERLAMAAEADTYIGKFLKVEYEVLSKDGIPLKPVGIMFRVVDANGEAIE